MFLATYNCSLYVINTKQEYSANRPEGMISQPKFTNACMQANIDQIQLHTCHAYR